MRGTLTNGHIGIRRFQPEDVATLFPAARESIDELCQWMVWCRPDYSFDDCRAFVWGGYEDWNAGRKFCFLIYDPRDGTALGSIGFSNLDRTHDCATLGYWVRKSRTGQGVATAAVALAARFGFEQLRVKRLELIIAVGNQASVRVAEKLGAHREGILRNRLALNGRACDAVLYALLAAEPKPHVTT